MYNYSISHRTIFIIGWAYYLLLPAICSYFGYYYYDEKLISFAQALIPNDNVKWAMYSFILFALVFYVSGSLKKYSFKTVIYSNPAHRTSLLTKILCSVYTILFLFLTYNARSMLFRGYENGIDTLISGPLSTLHMILLFHYLYTKSINAKISVFLACFLFINSIVLLGLGGRMYVISAIVAIYFRWWNWGNASLKKKVTSLLFISISSLSFIVLIAMWRVHENDTSFLSSMYYLTAESILTNISAVSFFDNNNWEIIRIPTSFLANILNLIPSTIWPDKIVFIDSIANFEGKYDSPLGAINIMTSSILNFGYGGALIFFWFVSKYMNYWSNTKGSPTKQAYYCFLVGLQIFIFFRDPLYNQVKLVLTGLILYKVFNTIYKH